MYRESQGHRLISIKSGFKIAGLFGGLFLFAVHLGRSTPPPLVDDLSSYVREIVENELRAQDNDRSCWIYTSRTMEGGEWRTARVLDTDQGILTGVLTQNGRALTPKEQQQEEEHMRSLVRSPRELSREASGRQHDWEKIERLARMLPDALLYTREAAEGQTLLLNFRPNPRFDPPTSDAWVFRAAGGAMLIDTNNRRIVGFRAELWSDLEFGWGLLGKLHKGSLFEVRQDQVAPGCWEVTSLSVNITGRVLFFKSFGEQRNETRFEFRRVPDSTPLEAAAEMLWQDLRNQRRKVAGAPSGP